MDNLIADFLSLPNILIYGIFGAIGGALGSLIGYALSKIFKKDKLSDKLSGGITIVCIILAIQFTNHFVPEFKNKTAPAKIMSELKEQRLFSVIFRLHPEAEEEFKEKMINIMENIPSDQVFFSAQAASAELVTMYLNMHMISASEEMTYKQIQREAKIIDSFKNKPQLCVSYYLGSPKFTKDDISEEFLNEESNLKADLIESSVKNPSMPPKAASTDEIINIIAESYQKNGYDLQGLEKLGQITSLTPEEGCKIATDFSKALASMEQKQSSYVFKNLLYISNQQQ